MAAKSRLCRLFCSPRASQGPSLSASNLPRLRAPAAVRRLFSASPASLVARSVVSKRTAAPSSSSSSFVCRPWGSRHTSTASHDKRRPFDGGDNEPPSNERSRGGFLLLGVSCAVVGFYYNVPTQADTANGRLAIHAVDDDEDAVQITGHDPDGPRPAYKIRLDHVTQHDRDSSTKWVVRGTKVFDITDFVEAHPGGEVILRACGGSVDAYWKFFTIHNKQDVLDILDQYYIGDIDPRDLDDSGAVNWRSVGKGDVDDPFCDDPSRDSCLLQHTSRPCNAETPASMLTDFLTPIKLWFVRNHLWVPNIDVDTHELTFEFSDGETKTYTLQDLHRKFPVYTITATMQCSGNRRSHMSDSSRGKTSGLPWGVGAIGTAEWTGVRLRDVLRDAGYDCDDALRRRCTEPDFDDKHVHFTAPGDTYAVSVPLCTALNPTADVLLAFEMNHEPITRDHGGPLRAVVPGVTAARSVKWLGRITLSSEEANGQYQKKDYKIFPPHVKASQVKVQDWDERTPLHETPVQSAIATVRRSAEKKETSAQGWAFSGGGRAIVRVDVSADGGETWKEARLLEDDAKGSRRWAWTRWCIDWTEDELTNPHEKREFVVRAVDEANNGQPPSFDDIWNFRGLCATAWHRVRLDGS